MKNLLCIFWYTAFFEKKSKNFFLKKFFKKEKNFQILQIWKVADFKILYVLESRALFGRRGLMKKQKNFSEIFQFFHEAKGGAFWNSARFWGWKDYSQDWQNFKTRRRKGQKIDELTRNLIPPFLKLINFSWFLREIPMLMEDHEVTMARMQIAEIWSLRGHHGLVCCARFWNL